MCYLVLVFSILIPPIGIIGGLAGLYSDFKYWKIYSFCIALGFASIAYCYYPKGDPDIVRYVEYIVSLKELPLSSAITTGFRGEPNTKLFSFLCWQAAKINDPQVIPALSTFFVYYFGLYTTCQVAEDLKVSKSSFISYILFILLTINLYSIINNVRNVLAFTIVSFAIFRDLYQGKRDVLTLVLYLLPLSIHPSAIVLIVIRAVLCIVSKMKVVMLVVVIFLQTIIHGVYLFTFRIESSGILVNSLKAFIVKAEEYYNDTSSEWGLFIQNSIVFKTERIANIAFAVLMGLMILFIAKKVKTGELLIEKRAKNYIEYTFILCLLTFSCWPMLTPQYWRFFSVSVLFCAIVYYIVLEYCNGNVRLLSRAIFLITPIQLVICIHRIAFSDLTTLIVNPFISSPIIILIKAVGW